MGISGFPPKREAADSIERKNGSPGSLSNGRSPSSGENKQPRFDSFASLAVRAMQALQ